ncbi:MAG: DUF432 domain-containing protein [Euryarchaeota archaeon]|nr:DUF432 domain-containing protein [Euryarchaeota archaeon]MBU4454836.1 DUF432 domain-containing protein [Euryarchaeota archaeon]MCG2737205.1 DUF432 domain-containing protein [Candidatus Methanoperedenaceae archaeon]
MENIEIDAALKLDFFGKEYLFERLDPFAVNITTATSHSIAGLSGRLSLEMKKDFYDIPYLIKFKDVLHISQKSQIKFFLKLPLVTKLFLKSNEKSIEVDRHFEYRRNAWHGEVNRGELCVYADAQIKFDLPFETQDALVPLRILNRGDATREIKKIVIDPHNLSLYKGDNGLFTNKVYIYVLSLDEFNVEYGTQTTTKAINPHHLIDRKMSVTRTVITRFDRYGIARELGL